MDAPEEQVGYLLADNVFAEPSLSAPVVTAVTRRDRVRVVPVAGEDGWFGVYRAQGGERVGFAFRPYVSRFGPDGIASYAPETDREDAEDAPLFEVVFTTVPTGTGIPHAVDTWANVRSGPGMNHPAFGVVRPDVPFQVLDVEDGWGMVRLEGEPGVGYVASSLLRRLPKPASPEPPTAAMAEVAPPSEPMREATVGSQAGGGVSEAEAEEASQVEALREALSETGVDAETIVYVTRTGRKFHREGCRHLRARTFAIPLAEAMMDFSPCRTCKPLQPANEPEE